MNASRTAPELGSVLSAGGGDAVLEARATIDGSLAAVGGRPAEVEFVLDGRTVARSEWPYRALIPASPGDHELLVRPKDPSLPVGLVGTHFVVR